MQESSLITRSTPLCHFSHPEKPHVLRRRSDPPLSVCYTCKGQHLEDRRYYYYCATCNLEFHKSCLLFPPQIRHPFHLSHPLTLTEGHFVKCKFCLKTPQLEVENAYYHCSTCNFSIHKRCTSDRPPLRIENLKSHDYPLTLFPRKIHLPCEACGFSLDVPSFDHVYSCLSCNYMVHKTCIDLPRVIKITRHPHRLSFISSIVPYRELSCGVCRKTVDLNYGSYSCNKGCHYAVHSKCATRQEVWDGKDLEGVPEEEEEEILEPFSWIDEETIQHFSHHHHHLKIHRNGNSHEYKFCQACTLPITVSDRVYSCTKCEFVLHETCASLPRKMPHPVHKHPLTLFHPFSSNPHKLESQYYKDGYFTCDGCFRYCCGFMYKCSENDCDFQLDARCASLPDPSIRKFHGRDHHLFFNFTRGECMGYESNQCFSDTYLECIKYQSFLCLHCATLPSVAHYKHDKHPLTLCYGEKKTTDLNSWCEICESRLDATKWFYTCNSCSVTLHVTCLLGKDLHYMKPNRITTTSGENGEIGCNNGNSRPVCKSCRRRCMYTLVYKSKNENFCSWSCYSRQRDPHC